MARKRLTDDGMEDLKSYNVKECHTYYMGASSSPELIYVEDIKPNKITYRKSPYYPEDRLTRSRDIIEDLIRQGTNTMKDNKYRSQYIDRKTKLKDIQRSLIKFKIKDKFAKEMKNPERQIERKYRDKYGLETNIGTGNNTFETTVNKSNVSKIRDLPEIRVLKSGKPKR